jgi:hypothetical protein
MKIFSPLLKNYSSLSNSPAEDGRPALRRPGEAGATVQNKAVGGKKRRENGWRWNNWATQADLVGRELRHLLSHFSAIISWYFLSAKILLTRIDKIKNKLKK